MICNKIWILIREELVEQNFFLRRSTTENGQNTEGYFYENKTLPQGHE